MSMLPLVLLTAALSAIATAALAYALYQMKLRQTLQAELVAIQDEFEKRVRRGVLAAGEELVPRFREQVSLGFQDALKKSQAAGMVEGAAGIASGAVNLGADIIETGLSAFLGIKPRK